MRIKYKNYILESSNAVRWNFIIIEERQRIGSGTAKNPNGTVFEFENYRGYDMELETIVSQILILECKKENSGKTLELNQFLESYKKQKSELIEIFKNEFKIKVS